MLATVLVLILGPTLYSLVARREVTAHEDEMSVSSAEFGEVRQVQSG